MKKNAVQGRPDEVQSGCAIALLGLSWEPDDCTVERNED